MVDVIGFSSRGRLFTANVTGNLVDECAGCGVFIARGSFIE